MGVLVGCMRAQCEACSRGYPRRVGTRGCTSWTCTCIRVTDRRPTVGTMFWHGPAPVTCGGFRSLPRMIDSVLFFPITVDPGHDPHREPGMDTAASLFLLTKLFMSALDHRNIAR